MEQPDPDVSSPGVADAAVEPLNLAEIVCLPAEPVVASMTPEVGDERHEETEPRDGDGVSSPRPITAPANDTGPQSAGGPITVEVRKSPAVKGASLQSPDDPDAAYGHKGCGYHVQIAETCRNPDVEIITDFEVHPANESDQGKQQASLERLDERDLRPDVANVDGGYCTGQAILDAQADGTELRGPVTGGRLPEDMVGRDQFEFDPETGEVLRCPEGHAPLRHAQRSDSSGDQPTMHAYFDGKTCRDCPLLGRCVVRPPNNGKNGHFHLDVSPNLRARDERLTEQKTEAWQSAYAIRAGIEATNSELKRAHGLGKLRVRRLPRVRLAVTLKLTACNVKRWLRGVSAKPGKDPKSGADRPAARKSSLLRRAHHAAYRATARAGGPTRSRQRLRTPRVCNRRALGVPGQL